MESNSTIETRSRRSEDLPDQSPYLRGLWASVVNMIPPGTSFPSATFSSSASFFPKLREEPILSFRTVASNVYDSRSNAGRKRA
jgi:hypothetical protein